MSAVSLLYLLILRSAPESEADLDNVAGPEAVRKMDTKKQELKVVGADTI